MSVIIGAGDSRKSEGGNDCRGTTIITAIFRYIEEADFLIELLVQAHEEDDVKQDKTDAARSSNAPRGNKRAKDDAVIIKEIKTVNSQLRNLITELMSQLESKDRKVLMLKERLSKLEEDYASLRNTEISSSTSSVEDSREDEV